MKRMLREIETELEREIAAASRGECRDDQAGKILEISRVVIGRLNAMTGKNFRPETESTLYLIRQKIEDGHTQEELLFTVDEMCARWRGDNERQLWLRPETLFGQHFEGYLQEALANRAALAKYNEIAMMAIERNQGGN